MPNGGRQPTARLVAVLTLLLFAADAAAQKALIAPVRRQRTSQTTRLSAREKLDHWTLQTVGEVTLTSPIVRLKDIVLPVAIPDAIWKELRDAAVTLVPTDGRRLTIERQRLLESVQRQLVDSQRVHWTGPESIYVRYERQAETPHSNRMAKSPTASANTVHKIAADDRRTGAAVPPTNAAGNANRSETVSQVGHASTSPDWPSQNGLASSANAIAPLPAPEVDRIHRLLTSAMAAQCPEVEEAYAIEWDSRQIGLEALRGVRSIDAVQWETPIQTGSQTANVIGTTIEGTVNARLLLELQPRPEAWFVRRNIRRGEQIRAADLEKRPLTQGVSSDGLAGSIDQLVGMEARNSLYPNRPLQRSDVKTPTVIHRGDLVELQVAGGGITVRSNARALGDGAVGELIEVETMQPRKKLMARVVATGLVEITTRSPQLSR